MNTRYKIALAMLASAGLGAAAVQGLHAQAKPKAYVITELETLDAAIAAKNAPNLEKVQGAAGANTFNTGGGRVVGLEGGAPPKRAAITQWDSLEKAEAFYKSKAWTDLAAERDKGVKTIRRYVVEARN